VLLVNSGSSANLIALKTLTSLKLKERRIKPGDEVITVAAGFPTTINPIIQCNAVPVFLDIDIPSYNIKIEDLEKALSAKTKAVMIAHTLGNPFNVKKVTEFCKKHNLWLVEDNCDALGSKYNGKFTGTFGDIASSSFYPAHHITTGEGGAVYTNNSALYHIARSFRDWGRDCWCATGHDNTCKKRFKWQLGKLPFGYDHKYIYSETGYNLKMTDIHAALGVAQMDKLNIFIAKRRENFSYLLSKMAEFKKYFILPEETLGTEPSWFGFLLTIKDSSINKNDLMQYLNDNGIATRLLFSGNITRQPYFVDQKISYRQIGNLENTDRAMNDTFWVGVYHGLSKGHLDYMVGKFREYFASIEKEHKKH
jgi:CDP-6-deoxy-D-xylo-4-hexulose-3-dehydrase